MGESAVFSLEEVNKHNSENDCWIVIHDKVYDVSRFLDQHPGGDFVILESGGGYATEAFEDVGHSEAARRLLKEYCIGVIDNNGKESSLKFSSNYSRDKKASFAGWTGALLPVLIATVAVAAYFFAK
ncbi:cytochrome B5 [Echinococcus multilocularis]|uniref:Cytochrome B5 n=1 Tax=Echinococcus multilocularis TaxID=6211 RepID=A0A068Y3Y8_ECHMU|nr:cytochrome B5 [Echinococcus multilocularis]